MRRFLSAKEDDFVSVVDSFDFTRSVTEIHLHHTWRPRQSEYVGEKTISAMWHHHTRDMGLFDIAQHVTIAPDGAIWLCRDFNSPPASVAGFNGNDRAGPFMVALIGNFDHGEDSMPAAQLQSAVAVMKKIQAHFDLPASALRFHSEISGAPCPGATVDKADLVARIESFEPKKAGTRGARPFPKAVTRVHELLRSLETGAAKGADTGEAELPHGPSLRLGARAGTSRDGDESDLERYRDHYINLDAGLFSDGGTLKSTQADADRIFKERIPHEIEKAAARGQPLNLLLYAHGGLVSEKDGIGHMTAQTDFWMTNGVFPVFFIWETGLLRTIRNLILGGPAGARAEPRFAPLDFLLERAARGLGGPTVWGGMKQNARRANSPGGGALYCGTVLKKLIDKNDGDRLRLHCLGHSAGAIFQAYLLEDLLREKKRSIDTLSLLAPAITVDLFKSLVLPKIEGGQVRETNIHTMNDTRERSRDPAMGPYGKSILYLIRAALEPETPAEVLGLERSLRRETDLVRLFGLHGAPDNGHHVVFAGDRGAATQEAQAEGLASDSRTHGGFDNDAMTMHSVVRRAIRSTAGEPITELPAGSRFVPLDSLDPLDFLDEELAEALRYWLRVEAASPAPSPAPPQPAAAPIAPAPAPGSAAPARGRRRAICIGIDGYVAISPLSGCVNDARAWKEALDGLGYDARRMEERDATAEGIVQRIGDFVSEMRAGDDCVLQFSGHGTRVADAAGGDESGTDGDGFDEVICAIDCGVSDGGIVLDDELRAIMQRVPPEASLTLFFDSCHSGTVTRARLARMAARGGGTDVRVRRVEPNAAMRAAYRRAAGRSERPRLDEPMHEVTFSACLPNQLAYERNNQGDFTRHALRVLRDHGAHTNTSFLNTVIRAFGTAPLQTPFLDCAPAAREAQMRLRPID